MGRKHIRLTTHGRAELEQFCTAGVHNARLVTRANIILALDISENRIPERQETIAKRLGVSLQTIYNAKRDLLAVNNVSLFLRRKRRKSPPIPPKVNRNLEDLIIKLVCTRLPKDHNHWTLRLLADTCVEIGAIENISHMTISRILKKHHLSNIY
jgi:DNA-binding CsgD family transcriptional regulator